MITFTFIYFNKYGSEYVVSFLRKYMLHWVTMEKMFIHILTFYFHKLIEILK